MNKHENRAGASDIRPPGPTYPTPAAIDEPIPARRAYPVEEARTLLGGISRKSIYDLINSGELETVMIAGRRLVPDASIDALLAAKLAELRAGSA